MEHFEVNCVILDISKVNSHGNHMTLSGGKIELYYVPGCQKMSGNVIIGVTGAIGAIFDILG